MCKLVNIEILIIDYDKTKDMLIAELNTSGQKFQSLKSCDALKILPNLRRIDFIEFKGISQFLLWMRKLKLSENALMEQVKKFELETKITHSFLILRLIMQLADYKQTREEREQFRKVEINYLVMVDVELEENSIQNLALTLQFMSEASCLGHTTA